LQNDVPTPAGVEVTAPARLHLGFLDLNGRLGRRFGSIGLAISDLRTRITIRRAKHTEVTGPEGDRVRQYLQTLQQALALDEAHAVQVLEVVPAHGGLGSGTQLALAIAAGLRRLHDLDVDLEGDATRLGRGMRSGIGVGLFGGGGVVVDGGRNDQAVPAPIISRLEFPDRWRILVVLDPQRQGVHGTDEVNSFAALAPMSDAAAASNCRLILMQALPALARRDLAGFGGAIKELQMRLGDYFAPVQGGSRFTSPDVAAVLAALDDAGAFGVGQSSWGPTGFAFAPSHEEADRLAGIARRHPSGAALDIRICRGLNCGAQIVAHGVRAASAH
jgi:beta-ribofuranosylaminobenzene 5'-phosphate synthase